MTTEGCRITGHYFSRRNRVFRAELSQGDRGVQCLVIKEHPTAAAAQREYSNLLQLAAAGVAVPAPLGLEGRRLYLQHLEGMLLADILEKELVPAELWSKALACWYARLHARTASGGEVLLKGDNNLRNFIFSAGEFYGLDFEALCRGDPAADIGQLCAFILADRPSFTAQKQAVAAALIRHYRRLNRQISLPRIGEELSCELARMAERRREERASIQSFLASFDWEGSLF